MTDTTTVRTDASPTIECELHPGFRTPWVAAALGLVTFAVFFPALSNDFVHWDDQVNIVRNHNYRGFGPDQLRWMFSTILMGHWIPVTWLTFALDYTIWEMQPFGYHLTNVVLHAINVALVYAVALRLIRPEFRWPARARHASAVAGALFFGLHPLRAESVAWVTERRDVLSMAFFLLSVLLYLHAHDRPASRRPTLAFSLVMFALGLASKSMIMTLPAVLLILDIFPLRRVRFEAGAWPTNRAVLIEKVPYAVLGLAGAAIGYYSQQANNYFTALERFPWPTRIAIVGAAIAFYVWKTLLPISLGPMYEAPIHISLLDVKFASAWLVTLGITVVALVLRRRCPVLLAGWASYLVMLSPVSGIAHAGFQLASDRYTYLPSLGLAWVVAAGVGALGALRHSVRPALVRTALGATVALLATLGFATWHQVQVWRDTGALWTHAIEAEPTCSVCHANLGVWLNNQRNYGPAIQHLRHALALRPDRVSPHIYLGMALVNSQRLDEGVTHFETYLRERPTDADGLMVLGVARLRQKRYDEARAILERSLEADSMSAMAYLNHATALAYLGRREEAVAQHRRAIDIARDDDVARARYAYASTLVMFGDLEGARSELSTLGPLDSRLAAQLAHEVSRSASRR